MSGYVTVWCSYSWTAKYFNCVAVHFFLAKQMMKIVIIILQLYKNSKKAKHGDRNIWFYNWFNAKIITQKVESYYTTTFHTAYYEWEQIS